MPSPPSILLFGHDDLLLYTRREILDRAGFEVRIASSLNDLERIASSNRFDLVVMCNSVSRREGTRASKVARDFKPKTYSLALEETVPTYGGVLNAGHHLTAKTFLDAVKKAIKANGFPVPHG